MGNNSVSKFIFRLSRFPVYRGSVLGRFYCICLSVRLSVVCVENLGSYGNDFHPSCYFFENLSQKCSFNKNLTIIACTLGENRCTFVIISRRIVLRMRNISDKISRANKNKFCVQYFFSFENCADCEICGKNIVEPDRQQVTT